MTDFIVAPVSEGSIESIQSIQSEADPKGQALGKGHTGHTYWEFSKAFLKLTWPLLLGNTLEWYEFGIYSYVEKEIAANFFGGSAMGAWLGYAVTFVARPLGGIILGFIGDHCGRKLAVNLSLAGMVFATVGQGGRKQYFAQAHVISPTACGAPFSARTAPQPRRTSWNPGGTLVPQGRPGPPRSLSGLGPQAFSCWGRNIFGQQRSFSRQGNASRQTGLCQSA
ncbi:unnamed protein product [Effrenium voratum]|uniref:Major facilitator superfamily (MFS) profile domain-containing protein n=1 Tax=Effrenium voratum TaxID=2562239 RepID=A0AA36N3F4_9DINO|nr:unnamed protein product [Effrenium voratum]